MSDKEIRVCAALDCANEFIGFPINKRFCSITCKRKGERIEESEYITSRALEGLYESAFEEQETQDMLKIYNSLEFARKENTRLANLANKHRNMADEILDAVYKSMSENLKQVTVRPPRTVTKKYLNEELVCNPTNADTQLGKVTPTYNSDIAEERIALYTDRILEYTDVLRGTSPIRRAVIGNHGRLSKFHNPESNMDRMLYKILEHIFAYEPRITFSIPDGHGESMFWAVDAIGNYSTLLLHGDQLPAPTSGATYQRRILGWKSGAIPVPFDDVIMGHWHQNTKMTINQTVVRISGSPESSNTFAQERLSAVGRPSQHLQFISPVHGVQWESDIYLDY